MTALRPVFTACDLQSSSVDLPCQRLLEFTTPFPHYVVFYMLHCLAEAAGAGLASSDRESGIESDTNSCAWNGMCVFRNRALIKCVWGPYQVRGGTCPPACLPPFLCPVVKYQRPHRLVPLQPQYPLFVQVSLKMLRLGSTYVSF